MIEGRHPTWNQQFIINNPETQPNVEGFLFFGMRDKYQSKAVAEFYLPIASMKPIYPYNFEMIVSDANYDKQVESRAKIYISCVLEKKPEEESFTDTLTDIIIHNTIYDPLPLQSNRMFVAMSTNNYKPKTIDYITIDLKNARSMASLLAKSAKMKKRLWLSSILQIPPKKIERSYDAVALFTVPKNQLDGGKITFLIFSRDENMDTPHGMPNRMVGYTDPADKVLLQLY